MTEKRREPTTKTPPDTTTADVPESQPEVLKKSKDEMGREITGQNERDRETVEKDLYDKDPRKKS